VEISSDTISQDEVNVVITLRDLHESMNEAKGREVWKIILKHTMMIFMLL
jgi:hypothetical protein